MTAALALLSTLAMIQPSVRPSIEQFQADSAALDRFYPVEMATPRIDRLQKLYGDYAKALQAVPFDKLERSEQIDWVLFSNHLKRQEALLKAFRTQVEESKPFLTFAEDLIDLCQDQRRSNPIPSPKIAEELTAINQAIGKLKAKWEADKSANKFAAYRAARFNDSLNRNLASWYRFYNSYDPSFSWWVKEPFERLQNSLEDYSAFLRQTVCGLRPNDPNPIVGDPIGREALLNELQYEFIPYAPEELVQIAEKEYAWCETEMKKAAQEMGFGSDWKKALEKVKNDYVSPGDQPNLIRDLALEAIDYVEKNDLVTVPPIAKETWRMTMMSREAQKTSPFFLGGEQIMVSFPTSEMEHNEKLGSLRANNIHFARATVHHELIPGHHLQQVYTSRYNLQRRPFSTPFWIEGNALYYEFLFWNMGFQKSPENRVGMLFWRMHRCARIVFSLNFHLKKMSVQECIDYLVDKVGHERNTAEGEVRRSFSGAYSPLYQLSYMIGALQIWQLRRETVEKGKLKEKEFHDRVFLEGSIPIELLRASVLEQKVPKDFKSTWRFYLGIP